MPQDYLLPFESGFYYHVYNCAVGKDLLFYQNKNYTYFLKKYQCYLHKHIETYAYCLIPNHYHLLIRIPEESTEPEKNVSEAFRKLGISFSQSINKQQHRKGSLFMRPFKRKKINSDEHLIAVIYYIHCNAVHHNMVKDFRLYKWSSYHSIISDKPTYLQRDKILELFGGRDAFIKDHLQQHSQSDDIPGKKN